MLLGYLDADTLRFILMALLTVFCYSLYKMLSKGKLVESRSKQLKGSWVKNKHVRSIEEAKFFLREALDALQPSLNLNLRDPNMEGPRFNSYFSLLRCVLRHARMAYLTADDPE